MLWSWAVELLDQNADLKNWLKMSQCHLVLHHYIWTPEAYNTETVKNRKSQSGLELSKPGQKQNDQKEFSEKGRYVQLYTTLTLPLYKPLLTILLTLFYVQRIRVCSKFMLQSIGSPGKSVVGCPFIFGVLHFRVGVASQSSGCYSHPHQHNLNTKSGHSFL